jgi:hypothetical protein
MKVFGWFSKLLIGTVFISSLSVLTTWYVVNLYVEEIFRQYQLPGIGKKVHFSDIAARLSEELNISKPKADQAQSTTAGKISDKLKDAGVVSEVTSNPASTKDSNPNSDASAVKSESDKANSPIPAPSPSMTPNGGKPQAGSKDAVEVWGQLGQRSGSGKANEQKDWVISTEDFAKKKDMLSSEDKMKIFTLVVSKLPQNEVQQLSTILEGGITAVEMKEVDQILQKYLKKEEYQQLLDILSKY